MEEADEHESSGVHKYRERMTITDYAICGLSRAVETLKTAKAVVHSDSLFSDPSDLEGSYFILFWMTS